jgi:selenocysteine-specific elongation factor
MIIATAGHIDHGKTALVKALTGADTDRLPEEKARGISIDLGFAYWTPPNGEMLGFVDVPGHERFVRNMLAGVCGIDYVMLVVAADDGVMPQTIEHLHILDLLGVSRGIAVVTKADRAGPSRLARVAADVRGLLSGTSLSGIEVLSVSALSGSGIPELRTRLASASAAHTRRTVEGRRFRYAIDRAFTVVGSGTVVTGTVFDGMASAGQRLLLSPSGLEARVRAIRQHDRAVDQARAGQRYALNLAGVELGQVQRGDWLLDAGLHAPTQHLDVRLRVLAAEERALMHWTPVHLHLGTCEAIARVAIRRGASINAGESGLAQLVIDRPVACLRGDRFIVRDQSAQRTIGGGVVVDPFAQRRYKATQRLAQLDALQNDAPEAALVALCACTPGGVDLVKFERSFNLEPARRGALMQKLAMTVLGKQPPLAFPGAAVQAMKLDIARALDKYHEASPQSIGMAADELRLQSASSLGSAAFANLLRVLAGEGSLEVSGSLVRRKKYVATENAADEITWQKLQPILEQAGWGGEKITELARIARISDAVVSDFLHRKARVGAVVPVGPERFFLRTTVMRFAKEVAEVAAGAKDGRFSAAQVRDKVGAGRQIVIQLLECLDRLGVTQRIGDVRVMRSGAGPSSESSPASTRVDIPEDTSPRRALKDNFVGHA